MVAKVLSVMLVVAFAGCAATTNDEPTSTGAAVSTDANTVAACQGGEPCRLVLGEAEQRLCRAYKEGASCSVIIGELDRRWCHVIKDGRSCSGELAGGDDWDCQQDRYPTATASGRVAATSPSRCTTMPA
jgi:hypothetical protein